MHRYVLALAAFVRVGNTPALLGAIVGGHVRRMKAIGLLPLGLGA